jgi:broad specificity phosphatase PhoE
VTFETVIYLVRHGQTMLNAEGRFRGRLDPPLDSQGELEAEALARWFGRFELTGIYSSPLLRTRQTAEPIGDALELPVHLEPGLLDLDYGDWTGLTKEEARAESPGAFARFLAHPTSSRPPGGESVYLMGKRVHEVLDRMAKRYSGGRVIAVSHELALRASILGVSDPGTEPFWDIEVPPGSVTTLLAADGRLLLEDMPKRPRAG